MPFATVGDLQIYYESHGSENAEPLLLLNGAFGVIDIDSDWGKLLDFFSQRYRLVVYEHRGHGRTTNPPGFFQNYRQLADDASGLLRYLAIPKAHIAGFSDGGITALSLASHYPELVDTLVVIGTNFYNTPDLISYLGKIRGEAIAQNFPAWASTLERQFSVQGSGYWKLLSEQLYRLWVDDSAFPTPEEISAIKAPTLVMTGQKDPFGTIEQTLQLNRLIPRSEVCILPGANHAVIVQRPEIAGAIIQDFISRQLKKRKATGSGE